MTTKLRNILDYMVEETIAVTFEKAQEAQDEFEVVTEELEGLWRCVKYDWKVPNDVLDQISTHAINGAAELIQVAAMARKWKESGLK